MEEPFRSVTLIRGFRRHLAKERELLDLFEAREKIERGDHLILVRERIDECRRAIAEYERLIAARTRQLAESGDLHVLEAAI